MKRCIACNTRYPYESSKCPDCDFGPTLIDGFESYAPVMAHEGDGFKASYFPELARLESANFWFRARNRLILWALRQYRPDFKSLLEIGCGTGYVLSAISESFPNTTRSGSDLFVAGLGFASKRLPTVRFMQMDARKIPFQEEFDVIGAFDVLEHIKEDELVLAQVRDALRPGGFVFLTVPQHAWLWSAVDEYAFHVRRYSSADIHRKIEAQGFRVIRSTSFVTTLLPAMMISRLFQRDAKDKNFDAGAELKISPWLNSIFYKMLSTELVLIKSGIDLPWGGSRFVVAAKI